jgi:hypothetical protein
MPSPSTLAEKSRATDQSPPHKRTEPREHSVLKPNAFGLPHTEGSRPCRIRQSCL